jgi:hypothetical protein
MSSPLPTPSTHFSNLEAPLVPSHVHHWRIGEQEGPDSTGTCGCGMERRFQNGWQGDRRLFLRPGVPRVGQTAGGGR